MRLTIAAVGRLKDGPERELFGRYTDRIDKAGRTHGLGPLVVSQLSESRAADAAARKRDEAARLLEATAAAEIRVALDETGRAMTSQEFAQWLAAQRDAGGAALAFLIGGPDGHDPEARRSARLVMSLGPMTLPHGLARIVLAEQIYRAITIIAGHPYHRE